jgi:hypothetical protein
MTISSVIKQDYKGLNVQCLNWFSRPVTASMFKEGENIQVKMFMGTRYMILTNGKIEETWLTIGTTESYDTGVYNRN